MALIKKARNGLTTLLLAISRVLKTWKAASLALAALLGISAVSFGEFPTAALAALADPMSIFAARSPGERPDGALTQTKLPANRTAGNSAGNTPLTPSERVLPVIRTRPAIGPVAGFIPPVGLSPGGSVPGAGGGQTGLGNGGGGFGEFLPGGGGVPPGGGGGGGGGIIPVSPIPEPATWLTMIAGFFALGGMIRSRRTARRHHRAGQAEHGDGPA